MGDVWVTADNHFNHDNISHYTGRPFDRIEDMNEAMIHTWNERVAPGDTIWVLGDFAFPQKTTAHISFEDLAARLHGTKHLIVGNHDKETMKGDDAVKVRDHPMWASVSDYHEFKFGKSRFVFCHYPFETWRNAHRGWYHLHGHCHGSLKRVIPHRMDVGVDTHPDLAPYLLTDIRFIFENQDDYNPQDHHGD